MHQLFHKLKMVHLRLQAVRQAGLLMVISASGPSEHAGAPFSLEVHWGYASAYGSWSPCVIAMLCMPSLSCWNHISCFGCGDCHAHICPLSLISCLVHVLQAVLHVCVPSHMLPKAYLRLQVVHEDGFWKFALCWSSDGPIVIVGPHEHVRSHSDHHLPTSLSEVC